MSQPRPPEAQSRADDTRPLVAEARRFLRANWVPFVAAALAVVFSYGLLLTSASLSEDDELGAYSQGTGPQIGHGRYMAALIQAATNDLLPIPWFEPALALTAMLVAAGLFAFLILRAAGRTERQGIAVFLFLMVALTLPVNAYFMTFVTLAVPIGVGLILAALSAWLVWLWAVDGWRSTNVLAGVVFAVLASSVYQSLVFVPLAAVVAAQLGAIISRDPGTARADREELRRSLRLVLPLLAAVAISAVIAFAALRGSGWHSGMLRWGSDPPADILADLVSWIASYTIGDGFVGGWVLIPAILAAAVLVGVVVDRALKGAGWWPVLLAVSLILAPFALGVALGGEQLIRTMQVLPLVAGSVWLLVALALPPRRPVVGALIGAAVLLTIWHASINGRLFWAELTTYENDRLIAAAIVERLAADGWDGETIPIVSVGRRSPTPIEDHADDEAIGRSLFSTGGGLRTPPLMITLGYPLWFATPEERAAAHEHARTMPDWPADGSVVLKDDIAIVRFSDDFEFSEDATW